jgi:hypothetical protein
MLLRTWKVRKGHAFRLMMGTFEGWRIWSRECNVLSKMKMHLNSVGKEGGGWRRRHEDNGLGWRIGMRGWRYEEYGSRGGISWLKNDILDYKYIM